LRTFDISLFGVLGDDNLEIERLKNATAVLNHSVHHISLVSCVA